MERVVITTPITVTVTVTITIRVYLGLFGFCKNPVAFIRFLIFVYYLANQIKTKRFIFG